MLSHHNLVANVLQCANWLTDLEPGIEVLMGAIPFFHVFGMTVGMALCVYCGGKLIVVPNPRPIDNVMNQIQKEKATIFPGVPTMYIGINQPSRCRQVRPDQRQGVHQRRRATAHGCAGEVWPDHRRPAGGGLWPDRGRTSDALQPSLRAAQGWLHRRAVYPTSRPRLVSLEPDENGLIQDVAPGRGG